MKGNPDTKVLKDLLEQFESMAQESCLTTPLTKDLVFLANKSQSQLSKGDFCAADNTLAIAMLTIKRNLGTEINLRQGFELANILMEHVRPHIAEMGVLAMDSVDFSQRYFRVYADDPYRGPGLPDYLEQRPFPEEYQQAAKNVLAVIKEFQLPKEQFAILKNDVNDFVKEAQAFCKGGAETDVLYTQDILLTNIYYDMLDMRGNYLTNFQIMSVIGTIIFAVPAWLCWSPPAIIVQILILVLGVIGYEIYSAMQSAAAKNAYKKLWAFIQSCTKTVAAALAELNRLIAGFSKSQKKDLKSALKKTRKAVRKGTMVGVGNKAKVILKLNAMIASL